jgi:hypothetical protein
VRERGEGGRRRARQADRNGRTIPETEKSTYLYIWHSLKLIAKGRERIDKQAGKASGRIEGKRKPISAESQPLTIFTLFT